MSYIGNGPEINSFTIKVEKFSGTGACTTYTLARDLDSADDIQVTVNGVLQEPTDSYSLLNGIITFTEAPSLGANNISVRYLAPVVVTYNQVNQSQILGGSVGTTQLATGAVTNEKIAFDTILGNKLAQNQISGNLIQNGAISGNNLTDNSIRANNIVVGQITGNLIGTGAISSNNFSSGVLTSNVLASNLQLSVSQVTEKINISGSSGFYGGAGVGAITGLLNIDVLNSSIHSFESNTTSNVTFNLRGNSTINFGEVATVGNSISVVIRLKHNTAGSRAQANVYIDGTVIDSFSGTTGNLMLYAANVIPGYSTITKDEYNVFGLTIFKTSSSSYSVMMSNTIFSRGS